MKISLCVRHLQVVKTDPTHAFYHYRRKKRGAVVFSGPAREESDAGTTKNGVPAERKVTKVRKGSGQKQRPR
jgi:hypothetical protein